MSSINPNHISHLSLRETSEIYLMALHKLVQKITKTIEIWQTRSNSRYQLRSMETQLLQDIGIDRAAAEYEANKPFWKA